jgi:hypothetical protein
MKESLTLQHLLHLLRVFFSTKGLARSLRSPANEWLFGEPYTLTSITMSTKSDKPEASSGFPRSAALDELFGPRLIPAPQPTDALVLCQDDLGSFANVAKDVAKALDPVSAHAARLSALSISKTFLRNVDLTQGKIVYVHDQALLVDAHVRKVAAILAENNTFEVKLAMAVALKNWPAHPPNQEDLVSSSPFAGS